MQGTDLNQTPAVDEVLGTLQERWRSIFTSDPGDLSAALIRLLYLKEPSFVAGSVTLASTGQAPSTRMEVQAFRHEGYSTYQLKTRNEQGVLSDLATVQFAPLFNGGSLIRRTLFVNLQPIAITEHYDENGVHAGRYHDPSPNLLYVNLTDMEPRCPIVSHLYNILLYEYQQAETGQANSSRISTLEKLLNKVDREGLFLLGYRSKPMDEALILMKERMIRNEIDPALTFSDKGALRANLKKDRATILRVKNRVHGVQVWALRARLVRFDLEARLIGIRERPWEKLLGTLHKYTFGVLAWFFGIVRSNIGYSVALAIYAPFTYYFITQPMNPGAMWTVGKVRKAYITTVEALSSIPLIGALTGSDQPKEEKLSIQGDQTIKYDPRTPYQNVKPRHGFLVSTDVAEVDGQDWSQRMSNFKQMQITYESNLQFSQRMGRLEQMENQLNFPLIAESSYRELEVALLRLKDLEAALSKRNAITTAVRKYLDNETSRTRQFKLYIWDKMVRYMLDHPYIVLDREKEHTYVDYYVGRNFIFLEEITKDLMKEYDGFRKPKGFEAIERLAASYRKKKIEAPSVEARLEKNHFLHKLKNGMYDGATLRQHLKRQWELLFLSYNRSQEASNFGLQMYVWSVRNSIWALGALMSSRNREFELLARDLDQGTSAQASLEKYASERGKIESLYESLFHILSLEYVSIRDELNGKLEQDIESTQRQAIIESLQESFRERTAFLGSLK